MLSFVLQPEMDVNAFFCSSTVSKSSLMVEIATSYGSTLKYTVICQTSFVRIASFSFRNITLLFEGRTNISAVMKLSKHSVTMRNFTLSSYLLRVTS